MILAEYVGSQMYFITVVVPVAVYFMILGLLNSRRHPQLLSARQDVVLLLVALGPIVILPVLNFLSIWMALAVGAIFLGLAAIGLTQRQQSSSWVIYNLQQSQAVTAIKNALDELGLKYQAGRGGFYLSKRDVFIKVNSFPLLRNTSVKLIGADADLSSKIQAGLLTELSQIKCDVTPMAMGLMLVATAMLVAPIAMIVHRAPQIVRIITDLMP